MRVQRAAVLVAAAAALAAPAGAQAGGISGTVTDAGGTPIEGVRVGTGPVGYGLRDYVYTAANGSYAFDGLEAGQFNVCFLPQPGMNHLSECWNDSEVPYGNPIAVPGTGTVTAIDASLATGGIVQGTVTNVDASPLAGICVSAWAASAGGIGRMGDGLSAADGGYTIVGLRPGVPHSVVFAPWDTFYGHCPGGSGNGEYAAQWYDRKLAYSAADPVTLSPGEVATGIDALLGPPGWVPPPSGRTRQNPPPPTVAPPAPAPVPPPPVPATSAQPVTTMQPAARCVVPVLKNRTVAAARTRLSKSLCRRGGSAKRYSQTIKRGRVIASKPRAGTSLPQGSKVDLVISKGARPRGKRR